MTILGAVGSAHADIHHAIDEAQAHADKTQTPCGVWGRDGWYIASEIAPDDEDEREAVGWEVWAVADPVGTEW